MRPLVIAALVGTLLVPFAGCVDDMDEGHGAHGDHPLTPVSGFADIHGMAVHSSRPNELYVATHNGLMRAVNDTGWARVGSSQDDYMGFSMHPTDGDIMWVSGHPKTGGNMGVRQSTDGGFTWKQLALEGVDFHAMAVSPADPDRLYGSFVGKIHRSDDGGKTWDRDVGEGAYSALVAHPEDVDTLYGVGRSGLFRSVDGGESFTTVLETASSAFAIHPEDPDVLFVAAGSRLHRSSDGGKEWTDLDVAFNRGTIGFLSFDRTAPDTIYAATYETGVYKTTDGGDTWTTAKAPR